MINKIKELMLLDKLFLNKLNIKKMNIPSHMFANKLETLKFVKILIDLNKQLELSFINRIQFQKE
jgi:hypothetical protein